MLNISSICSKMLFETPPPPPVICFRLFFVSSNFLFDGLQKKKKKEKRLLMIHLEIRIKPIIMLFFPPSSLMYISFQVVICKITINNMFRMKSQYYFHLQYITPKKKKEAVSVICLSAANIDN